MKNRFYSVLLGLPFFLPLLWRLSQEGFGQPIGLLSDVAFGLLALLLVLYSPVWLRVPLILLWALFQTTAQELLAAMQRLPSWQDVHYLFDPDFLQNSTAGFHLDSPWLVGLMFFSAALACWFSLRLTGAGSLRKGIVLGLALFLVHGLLSHAHKEQSIAARYNPLQWFISDALSMPFHSGTKPLPVAELPPGLRQLDLAGERLIEKGGAKNVLIVVMEGVTGLYHPEIRAAMGVGDGFPEMKGLVENTGDAMLIPDFVVHSHQTIRGLYAILCGDFSELSYKTPKAFELLGLPQRARECLPAQLAKNGWDTHYLQGAGLAFMSKDRVMPNVGFQNVHGDEWFTEPDDFPFEWGVSDGAFFKGARKYIAGLRAAARPWMLTLLTVGTHQPYSVPDEIAARYPSRKDASVGMLDDAVAEFIRGLRQDGVFEDTLVIFTSDESHGHPLGEWTSSWGVGVIMAPEQKQLPRLKGNTFGLVDVTASILDYFDLEIPPAVIGRSFFREYQQPREMVSFTANKLRWHTGEGLRYECNRSEGCLVGKAESILGTPAAALAADLQDSAGRLFATAAALDNKLIAGSTTRLMRFADGEIHKLPEKIRNEWSDNLVGAQYLEFPANSKVHVSIRIKAVQAEEAGVQLKLSMREWEYLVNDIPHADFPLLHAGEEARLEFDFANSRDRQSFSFHLTGEGKSSAIKIEEFNVTVM